MENCNFVTLPMKKLQEGSHVSQILSLKVGFFSIIVIFSGNVLDFDTISSLKQGDIGSHIYQNMGQNIFTMTCFFLAQYSYQPNTLHIYKL